MLNLVFVVMQCNIVYLFKGKCFLVDVVEEGSCLCCGVEFCVTLVHDFLIFIGFINIVSAIKTFVSGLCLALRLALR